MVTLPEAASTSTLATTTPRARCLAGYRRLCNDVSLDSGTHTHTHTSSRHDMSDARMGFHLRALFRVLATSEGEEAPKLGSPETRP